MNTSQNTLNISGMHCASCALLIKKSLESTPGVETASVNYATKKATVKTSSASLSDLKKAVKNAGYSVIDTEYDPNLEAKHWRQKFFLALALTLPLFVGMLFPFPYIFPIALVLTALTLIFPGRSFFQGFVSALKLKTFTMDSLIAIGTLSAFIFSLSMGTYHYFEVASSLVTFVTLGKWLESLAKAKTSQAISKLVDLSPKVVHLKTAKGYLDTPLESIKSGDIILVKPGEILPLDGKLLSSSVSLDQSALTGESLPVEKTKGSLLYAGTQNLSGAFELTVTVDSQNTLLSQIIKLVSEAQSSSSPLQDLADKISSYFVPLVILTAILTLLVWRFLIGAPWDTSLSFFLAVIVIACPCALGLATPTVIMVATGLSAKHGLLVKGGDSLQRVSSVKAFLFDKTGTLTLGKPKVTRFKNLSSLSDKAILEIVFALEEKSEHPIATALLAFSRSQKVTSTKLKLSSFQNRSGFGLEAKINNKAYTLGKSDSGLIELRQGKSLLATFAIKDTLRPDAAHLVSSLQELSLPVFMLTGDHQKNALPLANDLNIDKDHLFANILPHQKTDIVKKLQEKYGVIAFVGDGINDSPSLAQADLGIAMGQGTDIAIESGDVVVMNNKLSSILTLQKISQKTIKKINQNFVYALAYNLFFIPVAAGIFSKQGLVLRPEFAAIAMSLSSISVVLNSLTLNRFTGDK